MPFWNMPAVYRACALGVPALMVGCSSGPPPKNPHPDEAHLVILRSGDLEVGVLPQVGGRVVLLRVAGGPNLLKSNPAGWHPEAWQEVRANMRRHNYEGHTYWLGPQSEWWNQQDVLPQWKGRIWPPDPFITAGRYTIVEASPRRLVMEGPESPVSGVRLTKTVELRRGRVVHLSAKAENIRGEPVSWGLWSNTRFHGDVPFRVAMGGVAAEDIRYSHPENIPGEVSPDGRWFTFPNTGPDALVETSVSNKAFINASVARAEATFGDWTLVKAMATAEPDRIHPEQATVEVFLQKHPDREASLLELEFHGPYKEIASGESLHLEETWTLRRTRRASP